MARIEARPAATAVFAFLLGACAVVLLWADASGAREGAAPHRSRAALRGFVFVEDEQGLRSDQQAEPLGDDRRAAEREGETSRVGEHALAGRDAPEGDESRRDTAAKAAPDRQKGFEKKPALHSRECAEGEERFEGSCYKRCSILTNGTKPRRTGARECCDRRVSSCISLRQESAKEIHWSPVLRAYKAAGKNRMSVQPGDFVFHLGKYDHKKGWSWLTKYDNQSKNGLGQSGWVPAWTIEAEEAGRPVAKDAPPARRDRRHEAAEAAAI